ncbi:MAG: hypothetical protein M0C28_12900 [Candidatus Moduliflexus flocculans]|nr:hypothetical protein [Candidatus Moduliflexus flocculans]
MPASKLLFFDCETTGLPGVRYFSTEVVGRMAAPRPARLGPLRRAGERGRRPGASSSGPRASIIPPDATRIHGISQARARAGRPGPGRGPRRVPARRPGAGDDASSPTTSTTTATSSPASSSGQRKPLGIPRAPGDLHDEGDDRALSRLPRPGRRLRLQMADPRGAPHATSSVSPTKGPTTPPADIGACARAFFKLLEAGHFRDLSRALAT